MYAFNLKKKILNWQGTRSALITTLAAYDSFLWSLHFKHTPFCFPLFYFILFYLFLCD